MKWQSFYNIWLVNFIIAEEKYLKTYSVRVIILNSSLINTGRKENMSANNVIYINKKTKEVFYQGCADNGMKGAKLIGQGENLEESLNIADNYGKNNVEYGIKLV